MLMQLKLQYIYTRLKSKGLIVKQKKSALTYDHKFNGQLWRRCLEGKLRTWLSTPVEVSGARLQRPNHHMVNLPWLVQEIMVCGVFPSCFCIIFPLLCSILHHRFCVLVFGYPWHSHMIFPHQWYVHLHTHIYVVHERDE